ncbi:LacI family DNA-binding transcriptional regulator [soil metagenome]
MAARPTLVSVAQRARVSRQTVSNVINSPEIVNADTAGRVRRAITELDYRPSRAARQLRTRRSMMLALRLEPDRGGINGSVLDRFLHAVVAGAQAASYRLVLYTAADDGEELAAYDDLLGGSDLDGFLLTSTHHGDPRTAWLSEHRIPFSTFGRPWGAVEQRHSWVDVDGAAGTAAAVAHLVHRGHRRIGFLGWPAGSGVGDDRRSGWERALLAAGLEPDPRLAAGIEDDVAAGRAVAHTMLALDRPPTAVVCSSDSLALGALSAADGRLAVTGFDDTPVARAVGLTSVSQPVVEAAEECLRQIFAVLEHPATPARSALLQPTLTIRASTTDPP